MKKFTLPLALLFVSATVSAQVGVNTIAPKTTMDVSAKRDSGGNITDNTQIFGLQAPRLTLAELTANTATYGTNQQGALIYITDVSGGTATGQRINIDAVGYYSFDGSIWQKIKTSDINIYKNDGTLTSNRTLTQAGFPLTFTNVQSTIFSNSAGTGIRQDSGTGTRSSIGLSNGGTAQGWFYSDTNAAVQISATNTATSLNIGTSFTTASAPITFFTNSGGTNGSTRMTITGSGNIGINTSTPTEKLDNNGITRLRTLPLNGTANAINTNSSGNASAAQDQTFTATRTLVADANGVLGYVTGLPSTSGGGGGALSVGSSITATYSVPNATATVGGGSFRLGAYVTANGLTPLPTIDGIQMDLLGSDSTYYNPIIENVSSSSQLISYQSFATQVNENRTNLNQTLSPCPFAATTFTGNWNDGNNAAGWRGVDQNNIVFWNTTNAEVETTNLQVQIDATTYRWYELKWWCMEVSGQKKIFMSLTRKA